MSREILDDPSIVQPIFQELKKNFLTGETKSLSFRKSALKRLLEGYVALESEFNEALKKDLGHNEFFCYFGAHALTKAEVQDLINGVSSWIKPQSVPSPLCKTWIIQC
jgi:aldehyde dehydrogenase (NAD+)